MSGFIRNIYSVDRTNQAVALLAGATAHSYGSVSLHNLPVKPESVFGTEDLYWMQAGEDAFHMNMDSSASVLDRGVFDSGGATPFVGMSPQFNLDELVAFDSSPNLAGSRDLTSLFNDGILDSTDSQNVSGSESSAESDLASVAELAELGDSVLSLLDFVEQAVAEADTSQDQFANALDPATDPLLGTGYFSGTESIWVMNGDLLDSFLQPIGSLPTHQLESAELIPKGELLSHQG